jgi:diacylglycerol kinase (ATP)
MVKSMSRKRRFKFVVNPEAGRGKSKHIDSFIDAFVRSRNVEYNIQKCEKRVDATRIAEESSKQFDVVVAVGGDGTANEVANGLMGLLQQWA